MTDPLDVIAFWREQFDKPRFVYFIQADYGGPVKIGEAYDPVKRLAELQCGNAATLVVRAVVLATEQTEKRLHRAWGDARIRGEWFNESERILELAAAAQQRQRDSLGRIRTADIAPLASQMIRPKPIVPA